MTFYAPGAKVLGNALVKLFTGASKSVGTGKAATSLIRVKPVSISPKSASAVADALKSNQAALKKLPASVSTKEAMITNERVIQKMQKATATGRSTTLGGQDLAELGANRVLAESAGIKLPGLKVAANTKLGRELSKVEVNIARVRSNVNAAPKQLQPLKAEVTSELQGGLASLNEGLTAQSAAMERLATRLAPKTTVKSLAVQGLKSAAGLAAMAGVFIGIPKLLEEQEVTDPEPYIDEARLPDYQDIFDALAKNDQDLADQLAALAGMMPVAGATYPWLEEAYDNGAGGVLGVPGYSTGVPAIDQAMAQGGYMVYDDYGNPTGYVDGDGQLQGLTQAEVDTVNKATKLSPIVWAGILGLVGGATYLGWRKIKGKSVIPKVPTGFAKKVIAL